MSIAHEFDKANKSMTLKIQGRFDFGALHDFRKAYEAQGPLNKYTLDMSEADFMDSSALGMLLTLRDYAGGDRADIQIVHANDDIRKVIQVTKLDELFKIV